MTTNQTQTKETSKKRKRLTLEEQIARQEELLAKDKENIAKKQQRLRSLHASKMNKDRIQAQKKRNSMLIQLGLYFIALLNGNDAKLKIIEHHREIVKKIIDKEEKYFNENYSNNINTKEAKYAKKAIYDKKIIIEALNNLEINCLKYGKAKI